MANIDPLLRRNKDFAATGAHEGASVVAKHPGYVITCLDPRTDPSAFLALELGDAMVVRNAGDRVSPDVLKDLAYIGYLSNTVVPGGPQLEVAVVHHNQCGTHFLADEEFRRGFADLIGGDDTAPPRNPSLTPSKPSASTSTFCARRPSCQTRSPFRATYTASPPVWSAQSSPPRPCTPRTSSLTAEPV
jgi:hypothetical protein